VAFANAALSASGVKNSFSRLPVGDGVANAAKTEMKKTVMNLITGLWF
jgi:hypothetical protein